MAAEVLRQIRLGDPLRFAIRAALARRGLSRLDIAGDVFAAVSNLVEKGKGATQGLFKVIRALLQHANPEHNRVYASIATLAETAGVWTSTVENALALLLAAGVIRHVVGDELLHGDPCGINDGPHRHRERGIERRRASREEDVPVGQKPVNTYAIDGMFYCLPQPRRIELLQAAKNTNKVIKLTDALTRTVTTPSSKNKLAVLDRSPSADAQDGSISLATNDTRGAATGNAAEKSRDAIGPPGSPRVSSVGGGIVASQDGGNAPGTKKEPQNAPAKPAPAGGIPNPKNRAIQSAVPSRSTWTGVRFNALERAAVEALKIIGIRPNRKHGNTPVEIVRTMGAKWSLRLVEFWHWWQRTDRAPISLGYLIGTWEQWSSDPDDHEWDRDFWKEIKRPGRAFCSSVVTALARCGVTRNMSSGQKSEDVMAVAKPAPSVPAAPVQKIGIPADWLPGISEDEARDLCRRAVHLARLVTPGTPPLSERVRDMARSLWEQDHPDIKPSWRRTA